MLKVGLPPWPEKDKSNDKACVTPVQLMMVLNLKETVTVMLLPFDEMRALWPGENLASAGRGGAQLVAGTSTLKPYRSVVTLDRQPWYGA